MNLRKGGKRLSEADYQSAKEEFLKKLEAVTLFSETDDSKEERIAKGAVDAFYFAHTYLGHYFSTETQAEYHPEIVQACEIEEVAVTITGPRGGAKSTIVSFLEPIRDFCYGREDFIVLNMKSIDRAELYTLRILTELQHNPRIIEDFGRLVSMNAAAGNFATKRSRTRERSVRLMAWGDGMSMRGLVSEYSRPTKIICEDLQDREAAENPKRTKKLLEKIKADWLGATAAAHWKFIVIGNVICTGSIIDILQRTEKAWGHSKFPAEYMDAHGNRVATWPEMFPLWKLDQLREQMGDAAYEAEFLCEPREVDASFDERWFRFWKDKPAAMRVRRTFVVLDPSLSETGDNKGMMAINPYRRRLTDPDYGSLKDGRGKPYEENLYHFILRCYNRQATIDALLDEMYKWDEDFGRPLFYIDGTFGQKIIFRRFLGQWAVKNKRRLHVRYYKCKTDKTRRIVALQPDVQAGHIVFPPKEGPYGKDCEETITQFVRHGKPNVKDDGPDAISAGIEENGKRRSG